MLLRRKKVVSGFGIKGAPHAKTFFHFQITDKHRDALYPPTLFTSLSVSTLDKADETQIKHLYGFGYDILFLICLFGEKQILLSTNF